VVPIADPPSSEEEESEKTSLSEDCRSLLIEEMEEGEEMVRVVLVLLAVARSNRGDMFAQDQLESLSDCASVS